jgi:hypothetical protein
MSLGFASVLAMGGQADSEVHKLLKELVAGEGFALAPWPDTNS